MTAVLTIIVGFALGIAGYCVGFYSGADATSRKWLEYIRMFIEKDKGNENESNNQN